MRTVKLHYLLGIGYVINLRGGQAMNLARVTLQDCLDLQQLGRFVTIKNGQVTEIDKED